jgi:hypothetical protein
MEENNRYHIPKEASQAVEDRIRQASSAELDKWAHDPKCVERDLCGTELRARQTKRDNPPTVVAEVPAIGQRQESCFDPRNEVSADAVYIASRIVKHLWIIFVLLPVVLCLLYAILSSK